MPIPFILGAVAAGAGLVGAKKGYEAHQKNKQAGEMNDRAQRMLDRSKRQANRARKSANDALEALGKTKLNTMQGPLTDFVRAFEQLHHIDLDDTLTPEDLRNLKGCRESLSAMKEQSSLAGDMASGLAQGAVAGGLLALGAYGGAMTFGAASTGAAIAGLSGAAATNATLAFLGGGSLAAGGLGIAGGTAILGGIVAGPALAILGLTMDSKANENLETARSNLAYARQIREELHTVRDLCEAIENMGNLYSNLLGNLGQLLCAVVQNLQQLIRQSGTDFRRYTREEKTVVAEDMAVAKAVSTVINTPILTKNGALNEGCKRIADDAQTFLAAH
ncbi:hypothetical protein [uncultured Megasphaera sp.]|jgi:hypothetical protein|uniref:hypothetical protein n=1 Tax=uncultured Megasphaera sp. TaxID=165188 RepID=UPI00258E5E1C|nr:hypothetical protein [uncultured Megasphaera sp.]